jgi:hypothetical protein
MPIYLKKIRSDYPIIYDSMRLDLLFATLKTAALYPVPIKSYLQSKTAQLLLDQPVDKIFRLSSLPIAMRFYFVV